MKSLTQITLFGTLFLSASSLAAHEGHDHGTPGAVKTYNGGTLQTAKNADVEVLQLGKKVMVYVLDGKTKPIPHSEVKLEALLRNEKKKTTEAISLVSEKEGFSFEKDLGGERHTLLLTLNYKKETSPLQFTIESQ